MPTNENAPPLSFLVIGCGSIGRRHIGNLIALNNKRILAFDVRTDRRKEVESLFSIKTLKNLDDAWEHRPNAAIITAPTSMHIPLALQAAKHGCHLFIEKPLADKSEGLNWFLKVVKTRNLVTLVGCNMRFNPGLIKVKQLVEEKAIGRVIAARVEVGYYLPNWHPWEDYRHTYSARRDLGGGIILDAIHELDYIQWMLGEVKQVACFSGTEDTAAILLRFASGAIGEVHMDYVQRDYSRTCHVIGDEGTIRWDYTSGKVYWYSVTSSKWQVFCNPSGWNSNQMYLDEMQHFLKCLAGDERPLVDVFEATQVLKIGLAAKSSAKRERIIRVRGQWSRS
jgi:predicted dehydrogenase